MDLNKTDPVIVDLLNWLKENLPPEAEEEALFKNVHRVQKVFDTLIGFAFEEFYNEALNIHNRRTSATLEEIVNNKLNEMKEYVNLNEERKMKSRKLEASRAKLDLKKEQYKLVNSVKLDSCMDLISRYNHLMSKK